MTHDAGALSEGEIAEVLERCPDCGHDWSGHNDDPRFEKFMRCEGRRGLGSVTGCQCANRLARHIATLLADRAEALRGAVERLTRERDAERAERLAFTGRLGFGDGVTEPAATLEQMIDPIEQAFSEASEWHEGPRICEPCGEWLATTVCDHCHGSGCGPGTARGAYEECEWCAGVGKVHPGCAERSYDDLRAERDAERQRVARVEAVATQADEVVALPTTDDWHRGWRQAHRKFAASLRAALGQDAGTAGAGG